MAGSSAAAREGGVDCEALGWVADVGAGPSVFLGTVIGREDLDCRVDARDGQYRFKRVLRIPLDCDTDGSRDCGVSSIPLEQHSPLLHPPVGC